MTQAKAETSRAQALEAQHRAEQEKLDAQARAGGTRSDAGRAREGKDYVIPDHLTPGCLKTRGLFAPGSAPLLSGVPTRLALLHDEVVVQLREARRGGKQTEFAEFEYTTALSGRAFAEAALRGLEDVLALLDDQLGVADQAASAIQSAEERAPVKAAVAQIAALVPPARAVRNTLEGAHDLLHKLDTFLRNSRRRRTAP